MSYQGDYKEDYEDLNFKFTSRDSTGLPTVLTGTPSLAVYKGNDTTQSTAGVTLTADFDSVVGLNNVLIDLSADAFYAVGQDYQVVIAAGTVAGISVVGEVVGTFSIENRFDEVSNLAAGAGGLSVVADSFTLTTGTEASGTVTSTEQLDGTNHQITPSASEINCYYEFDVGTNGAATEAIWDGYVASNNDNVEVYGYDWVSAGWKQIGTIAGKNAAINDERTFILTTAMTGTGADVGKVRVRFGSSGGDVAVSLNTDRILCEYTSVAAERQILHSGVAQAASSNTITLDSGANANDDFYNHMAILIVEGTGIEQQRIIVDYNGTTKVATIAPPWTTNPDTTSVFEVVPGSVHAETTAKTVTVGLAQAGTSSTITLATTASATNDFYKNNVAIIDAGTGIGQERIITAYNGTTKVATIEPAWDVNPDTTSEYIIEEALCVADIFAISNSSAAADAAKVNYTGTITDFDSLDTAQDTQHTSTQSDIAALNNISTADIDARLAAIGLDHLVSASVTGTDVVDNSIIAKLVSKEVTADWDDFDNTTEALQALRDRGDAAWITAVGFSTLVASDIVSDGTALNTTAGVLDVVNLVNTTTTNTDMRGTDSANTVVPMSAALSQTEHDATQATLAGLNDFNPAVDKVFLGDGAHGGTSAVITVQQLVASHSGSAISITGTGSGTPAVKVLNNETAGIGVQVLGSGTGGTAVQYSGTDTGLDIVGGCDIDTFTVTTNAMAWNSAWDAEVQSEVVDGLNTYGASTVTTAQVNAEVLDVVNVDALVASQTITEALRRIGTLTSGEVTGAGTGTETFTPWDDGVETIVITVDSSGNRTAIAYN